MGSKKYSSIQLRDYSSLFSRGQVQAWLEKDFSSIDARISRYFSQWPVSSSTTYLQYLKQVYWVIAQNYQNEYVIKNSFLNEWLIDELGHQNSTVFNEFIVGDAIADLVMFNGVSKAFEIKTELDTDFRLDNQLQNYRKAFNELYIIIPESKLKQYENYDSDIGIIVYKEDTHSKFRRHRSALKNDVVDPHTIMEILHTKEYKKVVKAHYGYLPEMTCFNQFRICSQLIQEIPSTELNQYFIDQMKSRRMENFYSKRYFTELNQLFLSLKMGKTTRKKLVDNLKSPVRI